VNEAVTNAMKHAFRPEDAGMVRVSFRRTDGQAELRISDNGRGLPADFNPARGTGLGLRVLSSLAQQLHGSFGHESGPQGASFILRFPLDTAA
jgi:two-component sensor histidine kinase